MPSSPCSSAASPAGPSAPTSAPADAATSSCEARLAQAFDVVLGIRGPLERVHGEQPVDAAHARRKEAAGLLTGMVAIDGVPVSEAMLGLAEMGVGRGNERRCVADRL